MVNYACAFSQSELGKYFEWIIKCVKTWIHITISTDLSNEKQLLTNGAAPEHSRRQPIPSPDVSLKTNSKRKSILSTVKSKKEKKKDSKFYETKNILVVQEPYCPKPSSLFALFLSRFSFANSQTKLYYKNVKGFGVSNATDVTRVEFFKKADLWNREFTEVSLVCELRCKQKKLRIVLIVTDKQGAAVIWQK